MVVVEVAEDSEAVVVVVEEEDLEAVVVEEVAVISITDHQNQLLVSEQHTRPYYLKQG